MKTTSKEKFVEYLKKDVKLEFNGVTKFFNLLDNFTKTYNFADSHTFYGGCHTIYRKTIYFKFTMSWSRKCGWGC